MNNILKVKLFYNVNFLMIKQVEENKSKKFVEEKNSMFK